MDNTFNARHLDIRAFAQVGAELRGQAPLADWPRLASEQPPGEQVAGHQVHWRLQGGMVSVTGGEPRVGLRLWARADLSLQCQRCLAPVVQSLETERGFLFVADEATAEALDEDSEEDVLVISRDFDALSLVEDELILALPLVPRHDVCPQALPHAVADEAFTEATTRPNPFAALAALKKDT